MSGYNTQGRWEAVGRRVRTKYSPDGSGGWLVAECPHYAKEYAARIAALPELIEALEAVVTDYLENGGGSKVAALKQAKAALAKAKGESL